MARYKVLRWRGIPAQLKVRDDAGRRVSRPLPDRFQQEIDRVATREGTTSSEAYLAEWAWSDEEERPGTAQEVADRLVDEVAAEWDARPR
jgi:cvfA/B/C family virulence factor